MEQSLDAEVQLDKSAKVQHAADLAFDQLIGLVALGHLRPGIRLKSFEAERDSFSFPVQVENVDVYFIADLDYLARIVHLSPRQFRDVDQTIRSSQIHKGTEISDAGDRPMTCVAFRQFIHHPFALHFLPDPARLSLREN